MGKLCDWTDWYARPFTLRRSLTDLRSKGLGSRYWTKQSTRQQQLANLLLDMLAAISEFETSIRKERQLEGIDLAKSRGVQFGRKAKLNADQIAEMRSQRKSGVLIKE